MAATKTSSKKSAVNKRKITMKNMDCPTIYSNFMGVGASSFDLAIIFGELEMSAASEGEASPKVKVLLAPEQAANLVKMIEEVLKNYIAANGELRKGGLVELGKSESDTPVN